MKKSVSFTKAVEGYLLAVSARHLSEHTIKDYLNTFRKLSVYLRYDPPIAEITPGQIQNFLAGQTVSKKTVSNYHVGLSALWTWAVGEGLAEEHILRLFWRRHVQRSREMVDKLNRHAG